MTIKTEDAIAEIWDELKKMSADERLDVFAAVSDGYCTDCGWPIPRFGCHCMRED